MYSAHDGNLQWTKEVFNVTEIAILSLGYKDVLCLNKASELEVLEVSTGENSIKFTVGPIEKILGSSDSEIEIKIKGEVLFIHRINPKTGKTNSYRGTFRGAQICLKSSCFVHVTNQIEIYHNQKFAIKSLQPVTIKNVIENSDFVVTNDHKILKISENVDEILQVNSNMFSYFEDSLFWISPNDNEYVLNTLNLSDKKTTQSKILSKEKSIDIEKFWGFLTQKGEFLGFLTLSDYSFVSLTSNEVKWVRDEGLGHLKRIYFADLPSKALHHSSEYANSVRHGNSWADAPSNFLKRVNSQLQKASNFFSQNVDIVNERELIRDAFGINKLILAISDSKYIYALESLNRNMVWKKQFNNLGDLSNLVQTDAEEILMIFTTKNKVNLVWVFSVTGEIIKNETLDDYKLLEVLILEINDKRGVILLDSSLNVKNLTPKVSHENLFFYNIDKAQNTVKGYRMTNTISKLVWSMALSDSEEIKALATETESKIHQPAIATGTSRLIYKHDDKNMFALATLKGSDLFVYIINGVSGNIISKVRQDGVAGKISLVLHENKLIGHYWNSKYSRYEIIVSELFDSQVDTSAMHVLTSYLESTFQGTYSSFETAQPIIFTQTYSFPAGVKDMKVTRTLQGITTPDLVLILNTNQVYSIDLKWLSARRKAEEDKTEGVFDQPNLPIYKPNLPIVQSNVLSYYLNLEGLDKLETTWTLLESTSLAVAYGLDFFVVRVMPEKSFDMLTREFSHLAIVLTISGLIILNIIIRKYFSFRNTKEKFNQ